MAIRTIRTLALRTPTGWWLLLTSALARVRRVFGRVSISELSHAIAGGILAAALNESSFEILLLASIRWLFVWNEFLVKLQG